MQNTQENHQNAVAGGYQILSTNRELHVASVDVKTTHGAWKTIWNYDKVSSKEHAFSETVQGD